MDTADTYPPIPMGGDGIRSRHLKEFGKYKSSGNSGNTRRAAAWLRAPRAGSFSGKIGTFSPLAVLPLDGFVTGDERLREQF
ncbi:MULTISPECIES: hypothetical protein [Bradyrhizobium]|uniref:hypothetical protein n=1 Tax=Bradyrhizobium TaxID=374 RepID=UPI00211F3FF7|nr:MULTISPECIES: hypothetical protein [Bradyrhizobium]